MKRRLRAGMVGGGRGAFIGAVHRMAMRLDDEIELVAGAFSSDPEKSRLSGEDLLLDPRRIYADFEAMAAAEAALPPEEQIDLVTIVTPNATHVPIAKAFLQAGFHVVCDKPLGVSLAEAVELREIVRESGRIFALTHNYTGYVMVKEARELVRHGNLGALRKVVVEYPQGWMSKPLPNEDAIDGSWRAIPKLNGPSGCLADTGTHAEHLARYITGLRIDALCAEFTSFVPGRALEDDANLLIRYHGGAKGILSASQVSLGEENALAIRIYGTEAALEWRQEQPNELIVKHPDAPREILRPGNDYLSPAARRFSRIPAGHPEGFIEAFGNIYREIVRAIDAQLNGDRIPADCDFPTIDDGVDGMAFLECALQSARADGVWTSLPPFN
ncbi:MAG: Gfo/Idh/MocA family oxidoreductase [Chthoniobacterales bacterium]